MDVEWDSSSSHAEVRSLAPRTPNAAPPPAHPQSTLRPSLACSVALGGSQHSLGSFARRLPVRASQ